MGTKKGKLFDLLDAATVETARYVELRSKGPKAEIIDPRTGKPRESREGALLGNRLRDGAGLFLYITPSNSRSWRFEYRYFGQRRVLVYGSYPDLSLKEARKRHAAARLQLANGQDPAEEQKKTDQQKRAELNKEAEDKKNPFRVVAADWLEEHMAAKKKANKPLSKVWESNVKRWIKWANDAFGGKPLAQIDDTEVRALIRKVGKDTPRSAEFCRQILKRIWRFAIANGRAPRGHNPADVVRGALILPEKQHRPMLSVEELPAFLSALDKHQGQESITLGVQLLLHCFTRKNEVAKAEWKEIDFDSAIWTIPASRMKMRKDHIVPLSSQALGIFRRLRELSGVSPYVFPSRHSNKDKPIDGQNFNYLFNAIGYRDRFSPHGVRATATSILEDSGWERPLIDVQLAHKQKDKVIAAYFRGKLLERRREMLQSWSDMLDGLATGKVIPGRFGRIEEKAAA
jgi:integrase